MHVKQTSYLKVLFSHWSHLWIALVKSRRSSDVVSSSFSLSSLAPTGPTKFTDPFDRIVHHKRNDEVFKFKFSPHLIQRCWGQLNFTTCLCYFMKLLKNQVLKYQNWVSPTSTDFLNFLSILDFLKFSKIFKIPKSYQIF